MYIELFLKIVRWTRLSDHDEFIYKIVYWRPLVRSDEIKFNIVELCDDKDVEMMFDYVTSIGVDSVLFYVDVIRGVSRYSNDNGVRPSNTAL